MALASLAALHTAELYPTQELIYQKLSSANGPISGWVSRWTHGGVPAAGVAPTSGVVTDRATVGALGQLNRPGIEQRAWAKRLRVLSAGLNKSGYVMLIDRLAHMGGLDGTSTSAQTVNTPALTRYADGIGVMAALEVYAVIGGTATTYTTAYDSDSGTGHTSQPVAVATGGAGVNQFIPMSVQAGDLGVKKVSTVTLAATTGAIGNFGITLYKPLCIWPVQALVTFDRKVTPETRGGGGIPVIPDDACLGIISNQNSVSGVDGIMIDLAFFED